MDKRGIEDPLFRCRHAFVLEMTHIPGEEEYLFVPYRSVYKYSCIHRDSTLTYIYMYMYTPRLYTHVFIYIYIYIYMRFTPTRFICCSTFTVLETTWSENHTTPHEILVEASVDNVVEADDLPLAPWY